MLQLLIKSHETLGLFSKLLAGKQPQIFVWKRNKAANFKLIKMVTHFVIIQMYLHDCFGLNFSLTFCVLTEGYLAKRQLSISPCDFFFCSCVSNLANEWTHSDTLLM